MVDPEQEKIGIDYDFYLRNQQNLNLRIQGFVKDHPERGIGIRIAKDDSGIFMLNGVLIAERFGLKGPTKAKIEYVGQTNMFFISFFQTEIAPPNNNTDANNATNNAQPQHVIEISSDDEEQIDELQLPQDPNYFEKTVTAAMCRVDKKQVLHFPTRVARDILTEPRKTMWLLDVLTGNEYNCTLTTAKRNSNEKWLTGGWFNYLRNNNLQIGDKLLFDFDSPPNALFVELVPSTDIL